MAEAMTVVGYEKRLTSTDVSQKLVVPVNWLEIMPNIEENNSVQIRALDGKGIYWEFYLTKRSTGYYKKPVLQSKEWARFVRKNGVMAGDKFVIQKEDDHFRGAQYRVRVQRLVGGGDHEGHWVDLDEPEGNGSAAF